jgi:hypothetical protein
VRTREATLDQRTGRLALTLTAVPHDVPLQQVLGDLADTMTRMVERAIDDGRNYEIQVRITADIAVDAAESEVGEYVTELPLQVPDHIKTLETDGIVFHRTILGWERVE